MYVETMLWSVFTPSYPKSLVQRMRPYTYNDQVPIAFRSNPDMRRSFFSGHTCVAFSSAVFLSTVFSAYFPKSRYRVWVWMGSIGLAATAGMCRMLAGAHFTTDVLAGAVAGSLIGFAVPALHLRRGGNAEKKLSMTMHLQGFSLYWKLEGH